MRADELEALLVDEAPRLLRLARRLAPAGIDPSDLVQDTAERAWRAREQIGGRAGAAPWLRRILVNRLRDLARRRALISFTALESVADPPDLGVRDPAAVVEVAERDAELRVALRALPGDELLAVVLHDGEGWGAADVAAICGCSTAAAHKRIQRGRMRLTAELAAAAGCQPAAIDDSCRAARRLASGYLDGELDEQAVRDVGEHLSTCTACPPVLQALQGVVAAVATAPAPPDELLDAMRAELARHREATDG